MGFDPPQECQCRACSFPCPYLYSLDSSEDPPKSVVILDPPWDRLLEKDSVTLKCQGAYPPGDDSTEWRWNGTLISNKASSYSITDATVGNSGEYTCKTGLSAQSDPLRLEVYKGWLLLQAPRWVVQEGESIRLRCHTWKNITIQKVQYFQNGMGKKFSHQNFEYHIPNATLKDGGSYFCRGIIKNYNLSSEAVKVTVQGSKSPSPIPSFFLPWHQIIFCLVMGFLFAVDTGLYFSVRKVLRSSKEDWRNGKVTWSRDPQDKGG
uniref:Low affinity immunoglobulin gamma Fc region receptor III-A n=1 Tax=Sus scrofa TaxID=9823 RepID=A0A8D0WFN2_PIG